MTDKTGKTTETATGTRPKPKRLSKGQRTHIRRMKQEKRKIVTVR